GVDGEISAPEGEASRHARLGLRRGALRDDAGRPCTRRTSLRRFVVRSIMISRSAIRRAFRLGVLWLGIVLCMVAVWRIAPRLEFELRRLHGADIACVAAMAVC